MKEIYSNQRRIEQFNERITALSYKEMSEITGSSVPKLKIDLHRAKIEIRRIPCPYLEAKQ